MTQRFIGLVATLAVVICFFACRKSSTDNASIHRSTARATIQYSPTEIGIMHNEILGYLDENIGLDSTATLSELDARVRHLLLVFNDDNSLGADSEDYAESLALTRSQFTVSSAAYGAIDLAGKFDDLVASLPDTIMSNDERSILHTMFQVFEDNRGAPKTTAYSNARTAINTAKNSLDQLAPSNGNNGFISYATVAVADNSLEYWNDYPHPIDVGAGDLPLWLGLDALAAIGGAGAVIGTNLWHHENIDWKQAGVWALSGAVVASVPSTRWFKLLFS